ncbi:MAG: hypothetical protein ACOC1F_03395 [Myxococcota bacterium]
MLLVGAVAQHGPPFDAAHWPDYLPAPWPELVALMGEQRSATFEGKTPQGNRLVVVCARTPLDMRRAIASLQLGPDYLPPSTQLPLHEVASNAPRVTMVLPDASFTGPCKLRLEALGYRPWSSWGTNFHGFAPSTQDEVLLIGACLDRGAPFDAAHWSDYLPAPWPELAEEIRHRIRGQLETRSRAGARVLVAFGKGTEDLREALRALHF